MSNATVPEENQDKDQQINLQDALGDYVAGDLSDQERNEVEAQLADQESLAAEKAYWEQMLPALKTSGRPQAAVPGAGMADVIDKRMQETANPTKQQTTISFPEWLRYVATAAAAAIIAVVSFNMGQTQSSQVQTPPRNGESFVAYNEHGDAIYVPVPDENSKFSDLYQDPYLSLHQIEHVDARTIKTISHQQIARPYLGLLIKPITLDNSDRDSGALVLQVMGDSPAAASGIQPGDVVLSLAECPMMTNHCMLNALIDKKPGETINIVYLDKSNNTVENKNIKLGATYE